MHPSIHPSIHRTFTSVCAPAVGTRCAELSVAKKGAVAQLLQDGTLLGFRRLFVKLCRCGQTPRAGEGQ